MWETPFFFYFKSVYFCKYLHCFLQAWNAQLTFYEESLKITLTVPLKGRFFVFIQVSLKFKYVGCEHIKLWIKKTALKQS